MPPGSYFAVAAPGLEPYTARELQSLELPGQLTTGGVAFRGTQADLYRTNLCLRTASRVLARAGEFYAAAFSELRKKASHLPWETFLRPGQPVAIKATSHKSKLYHSDAVAERVAGAIGDRLGRTVPRHTSTGDLEDEAASAGPQPQLVVVRLVRDVCTISVDASGALLHQRGYRLATARAPLRETLAAGMLMAANWDRAGPLLDPFCGSGTIPIEAALLALNIAPGRARPFAFMDWPDFDPGLWSSLLAAADADQSTGPMPIIQGSDRDAGAIEAAQANAARAGVGGSIQFQRLPVSAIKPPPGPGWVVTNLPYGVRLNAEGGHDLRNLYAQFGKVLLARCPGWQVAFLSGDARLCQSTGLRFDAGRTVALRNGGLQVKLVQARVAAASQAQP